MDDLYNNDYLIDNEFEGNYRNVYLDLIDAENGFMEKIKKEIKVVYRLIYDDELNKRLGLNRFYHLNGDIETDADGNGIYICSRWNKFSK